MLIANLAMGAELPEITQHSPLRTTVYKGDSIEFQVITYKADEIQWWILKDRVCEGEICTVDTSSLSVGIHNIVTVLVNEHGSQFLNFSIKVKENLDNRSPKKIQGELTEPVLPLKSFNENLPFIVALKGTGFSWRTDKLEFIKKAPRNLDWDEKIKSTAGTLKLGKKDLFETYLMPGTQVRLMETPEKAPLVLLQSGTLRYRHLIASQTPQETIILGDWLQIDGSNESDFIVDYDQQEKVASLYTLSGQVRLTKQSSGGDLSKQGMLVIPAGVQLHLKKDKDMKKNFKILPLRKIAKLIQSTTPHLLGIVPKEPQPMTLKYLGVDYNNPLQTAESLIRRRGYTVALEVLQSAPPELKEVPQWGLLMGEALGKINLARRSLKVLKPLFKSDPSSHTGFLIAMRYFENHNWKKAKLWFEKSLELDGLISRDLALYYLGVIAFKEKDYPVSVRYFTESTWYSDEIPIIDSSEEFIDLISYYNDWGVVLTAKALLDTNIFRTSSKDNLSFQDDISGLSGVGYHTRMDIWKFLFYTRYSSLNFGYKISRTGWLKKTLAQVDFIDQSIYSQYRFGKEFQVSGGLALVTKIVGSERAADGLVSNNLISWDSVPLKPRLHIDLGVYKDPLPTRNDILDPLSFELQESASDRSSRRLISRLVASVWEAPRQVVDVSLLQRNRTFTNTLLESENSNLFGLQAEYRLRFWGLSQFFSRFSINQRAFSDDPNSRKDDLQRWGFGYSFDMEHDGNFHLEVDYQKQDSTISKRSYHRYLVTTGIELIL